MRVLVADNNKTVTKIVRMVLEDEGYSVEVANSPDEVRKIVSRVLPEVILLDTKFEKSKDGYSIAEEILKKDKNAKIIMLINPLEKPDKKLAEELGIVGFLTKPVDSRKLLQIIAEIEEEIKEKEKGKKERKVMKREETVEDESEKFEIGAEKEIYEDVKTQNFEEGDKGEQRRAEAGINLSEASEGGITSTEDVSVEPISYDVLTESRTREENFAGEEIGEEKRDISFEWIDSRTSEIASEISILLEGVKEMFGSIKDIKKEAESYVKEISDVVDSLKKKVEEIPETEKLISHIMSDVLKFVEPHLRTEIENLLRHKIEQEVMPQLFQKLSLEFEEKIRKSLNEFFPELKNRIIYGSDFIAQLKNEIKSDLISQIFSDLDKVLESKANHIFSGFEKIVEQKVIEKLSEFLGGRNLSGELLLSKGGEAGSKVREEEDYDLVFSSPSGKYEKEEIQSREYDEDTEIYSSGEKFKIESEELQSSEFIADEVFEEIEEIGFEDVGLEEREREMKKEEFMKAKMEEREEEQEIAEFDDLEFVSIDEGEREEEIMNKKKLEESISEMKQLESEKKISVKKAEEMKRKEEFEEKREEEEDFLSLDQI